MTAYKRQAGKDLYAVLGVKKDADAAQIRKAYRKLAKKYHPDSNAGNAEAEKKFKEVSEANAILGDAEKRKIYDEFGYAAFENGMDPKEYADRMREAQRAGFGGSGPFGGFGGGGGFGGFTSTGGFGGDGHTSFHFESGDGGDYSDLFDQLFGGRGGFTGSGQGGERRFYRSGAAGGGFGGFGTGTGSFRSAGASPSWGPEADLDAEISVRIPFRDAVLGCDRDIRLQKTDGSGTQTLRVHIPAGIDDGKTVRLRGKGHMSADGKRRGDLLLRISVDPDKAFTRKGQDLYTTAEVPFTTAVFGGEAEVRMPDGKKILCKVPGGTGAGKKIRIRGKGIRQEKSSAPAGDLYVSVQVEVPADLTGAEAAKLREFEKMYEARRRGGAQRA